MKSVEELVMKFPPPDEENLHPDRWAAGYLPRYHRFSTSETREIPFELNREVLKMKLFDSGEDVEGKWVLRARHPDTGHCIGFYVTLEGSFQLKPTRDPAKLGYGPVTKTQK